MVTGGSQKNPDCAPRFRDRMAENDAVRNLGAAALKALFQSPLMHPVVAPTGNQRGDLPALK